MSITITENNSPQTCGAQTKKISSSLAGTAQHPDLRGYADLSGLAGTPILRVGGKEKPPH